MHKSASNKPYVLLKYITPLIVADPIALKNKNMPAKKGSFRGSKWILRTSSPLGYHTDTPSPIINSLMPKA